METKLVLKAALVKEPTQKEAALNNSKASLREEGGCVVITVPLDELEFCDSKEPDHGYHRWIWLDIDTGLRAVDWLDGLTVNGLDIEAGEEDKKLCGNEEGHFILCIPAEAYIRKNRVCSLSIRKEGVGEAVLDIRFENTSEFSPDLFILDGETILKAEPRAQVPAHNNSLSTISRDGNVFTITTPLKELKQVTSVVNPQFGSHSWMWIGLDVGLRGEDWNGSDENKDALELNGKPALDRYTPILGGGKTGHITVYPQADAVALEPKVFIISKAGYKPVSFTIKVIDSSN